MYLVVSVEINTCKKHFAISGLVIFKAFGVERRKQTGFCFTQLQRHCYYGDCTLWCPVQLRCGSVPTLETLARFRKSPAALGWGLQQAQVCSGCRLPGCVRSSLCRIRRLFSFKMETLCRLPGQCR